MCFALHANSNRFADSAEAAERSVHREPSSCALPWALDRQNKCFAGLPGGLEKRFVSATTTNDAQQLGRVSPRKAYFLMILSILSLSVSR